MGPGRGQASRARALETYIQLMRAADLVSAELHAALGGAGLTPGQLGVLEAIGASGPLSLRALGERLFRSAPNMTIVVDNLERAGLVRRVRDPADRRVVLVESTPEGRRRLGEAYPEYTRVILTFMAALTRAEQAQLARACGRLRERRASQGPHERSGKRG